MKFQKLLFTLTLVSLVFIGCKNNSSNEPKQELIETASKELAINISGMTCEIGCAKLIQSKLTKQEGVLDAKVVFKDSIATIKYDAAKTNKASLISFVNGIADHMYKASEAKSCSASSKKDCKETKPKHLEKESVIKDPIEQKTSCKSLCAKPCCNIVSV